MNRIKTTRPEGAASCTIPLTRGLAAIVDGRFLPAALLWAAITLTIFGLLAITTRPELTVLAWGGAFLLVTCERVTQ